MTLYQDGVDEQESMGRTTSRSEIRVRAYKRGNADIACTVSKSIIDPQRKNSKMLVDISWIYLTNKLTRKIKLIILYNCLKSR